MRFLITNSALDIAPCICTILRVYYTLNELASPTSHSALGKPPLPTLSADDPPFSPRYARKGCQLAPLDTETARKASNFTCVSKLHCPTGTTSLRSPASPLLRRTHQLLVQRATSLTKSTSLFCKNNFTSAQLKLHCARKRTTSLSHRDNFTSAQPKLHCEACFAPAPRTPPPSALLLPK